MSELGLTSQQEETHLETLMMVLVGPEPVRHGSKDDDLRCM